MEKKTLYLVVAASGMGKDYVVDKLCKEFNKKKVISRTTRKQRYEGEDTHIFVSEKMADEEFDNAVAKTVFNGYRYYATEFDVCNSDFYIIDPNGIYEMKNKDKYNPVIVYIKSNIFVKTYHMIKRGDKLRNIISRLINDRKEFKGFKGDLNFKSSNEMYEYFKEKFSIEKDKNIIRSSKIYEPKQECSF